MKRAFGRVILISMLVTSTACVQVVEIENEPARVTSVGPIEAAAGTVAVRYTVRDFEGDDQTIRVEICEAPSDDCGVAVAAPGGDPTGRVPTVPENTDVLHEFRWASHCGRYVGSDLVESDGAADYVARVSILGQSEEAIVSEEFSLEDLNIEERDCE